MVASLRELPPTSHPSALLNYPSPGLFTPQGADRSNFVSRRPQRRNYRRPGICLGPWILLTSSTTLEKADGRISADIVVTILVFTLLHFSLIVSSNVRHFKIRKLLCSHSKLFWKIASVDMRTLRLFLSFVFFLKNIKPIQFSVAFLSWSAILCSSDKKISISKRIINLTSREVCKLFLTSRSIDSTINSF